jgi:hypothetical protein
MLLDVAQGGGASLGVVPVRLEDDDGVATDASFRPEQQHSAQPLIMEMVFLHAESV